MGGDSYDREVVSVAGGAQQSQAATQALAQRSFAAALHPLNKQVVCAAGTPVVVALDISGSMSDWPKIFYDKLPMFYGQLVMQGYVPDPALSFAAFAGGKPLQASDFAQGTACDDLIKQLFLCGGGGPGEPYADAAYFYQSSQVSCTGAVGKPFFFFTGDEVMGEFGHKLEQNVRATIDPNSEGPFDLQLVWDNLKAKYHVFHVAKPGARGVKEEWQRILGADRVLCLATPKAVVDCILGAIAITSGARTHAEYVEDLKERGQTEERQREIAAALACIPAAAPAPSTMAPPAGPRAAVSAHQYSSCIVNARGAAVFDLLRPMTFKWMSTVASASKDEETGHINIAYTDHTVQNIHQLELSLLDMSVAWEVVSSDPPSHCASQVHTIQCHRVTDTDRCFVSWNTDFSADATVETIEDAKWKKNDSFEQLKSFVS